MQQRPAWLRSEADSKLVLKPWGNGVVDGVGGVGEIWLNYGREENIGDEDKRYVFKKLFMKAGTKTSFQYHVHKVETNHLVSGKAEAYLENEAGEIEMCIAEGGDSWSIPAGRKHRIIVLDDVVLLEASSPEVDDVVRIADDAGRGNGRIASEHEGQRHGAV